MAFPGEKEKEREIQGPFMTMRDEISFYFHNSISFLNITYGNGDVHRGEIQLEPGGRGRKRDEKL